MLSNTAVPIYYGEFRDKVLAGEILVNEEISLEMNRIDRLIENPGIYYDDEAINGWIAFCESELTLTDGSELNLLFTFKLWAEQLFSWFYFIDRSVYIPNKTGRGGHYVTKRIKKRLTKKQFLILARGGAKSMYLSGIQSYGLVVDTDTTHQITTAPTMRQAEEVLSPIRTAISRSVGPVFKFLTLGSLQNTTGSRMNRQMLASTKKGVENFVTGSLLEIRPMTINKLQGLRCKYATVDEWLSGDLKEDPIGAIEQGAAKGDMEYVIVAASSEGTVRNGSGDDIKMELLDILRGKYEDPHTSIWYYRLDDIKEVGDPDKWIKAQPNLGLTVSYETYQLDVERAEKVPAARNDILAKRFGIPMEGFTYFFTYEDTIPHPKKDFRGLFCSVGIDLSQGDDFCAFDFLFPLGGEYFGVKARSYISSNTYSKLAPAMRRQYDEFIREGSLIIMEGVTLDLNLVYEDLEEHMDKMEYEPICLGYDPYGAKEFINRWTLENGPFGIVKVIQGARTESVPLGEIQDLAEQRRLLFDEQIMKFTMGNAITIEDTNGNRKLYKKRAEAKIDNVAALMDAWVAFKLHKEAFE